MKVLDLVSEVYGRRGTTKGWKDMRRLRWGLQLPWLKVKHAPSRLWYRWKVWRVPDAWLAPPTVVAGAWSVESDVYGIMQRISVDFAHPVVHFVTIDSWAQNKQDAAFVGSPKSTTYMFTGEDELIEWLEQVLDQVEAMREAQEAIAVSSDTEREG